MAFHVYAALNLAGEPLSGDTTITHIGDVDVSTDHIEIYELNFGAERQGKSKERSSRPKARHRLVPVRFVKRTDQTTPLLYRGLNRGQILEGEIKLFDADPDTGEIRQRFAITLRKAQITAVTTTSPDVFDPEESNRPVYDFLEIVPQSIVYEDRVHAVEFEDAQAPALRKKVARIKTAESDKKRKKKAK
jgi:type VI secretion system Hcp family effector